MWLALSPGALIDGIAQEMLRWGWRIQLPQARGMVLVAVAVILMYEAYLHFSRKNKNDQVAAIGAQLGIKESCLREWSKWFHRQKEQDGRRGNRRGGDYETWEIADLAREFLDLRPSCNGR